MVDVLWGEHSAPTLCGVQPRVREEQWFAA
jgi:hypothetical protein